MESICSLTLHWAAVTRGHCHPPLKEVPKCFVRSSTSAALGFGGSFWKIFSRRNPNLIFILKSLNFQMLLTKAHLLSPVPFEQRILTTFHTFLNKYPELPELLYPTWVGFVAVVHRLGGSRSHVGAESCQSLSAHSSCKFCAYGFFCCCFILKSSEYSICLVCVLKKKLILRTWRLSNRSSCVSVYMFPSLWNPVQIDLTGKTTAEYLC